ncbi:MAG: SurA N-terminal domain-containing protein [Endomicrobium sp.]|jgi:parvulin-like peptidyl-prolyl isomerase|nr:SurA N-terminal domain-containing protein [Endomicrobium sp.]
MKRFFVVVLIATFMTLNVFGAQKVADQTLAIVNGAPIFASDFNKSFTFLLGVYKQTFPLEDQTDQKIRELKDFVLNEKIDEILLLQEAKKQKIKISKKEIDDSIREFKKQFKDEHEFNLWLKKTNITTVDFENRLISTRLLRKTVGPNVKMPTENELKTFYGKVLARVKNTKLSLSTHSPEDRLAAFIADDIKMKSSECVKVKHIFISCPKNATSSKIKIAREKVAIVKKELQKQHFADVAKRYSEDSLSRKKSGGSGLIIKNDKNCHPSISKVAFSTRVGDHTKEPIKTEFGYHFIRVEGKYAGKNVAFDDVKNDISRALHSYNLTKAVENYVHDLRSKANIKINNKI